MRKTHLYLLLSFFAFFQGYATDITCFDLLHEIGSPYRSKLGDLLPERSSQTQSTYLLGKGHLGEKILRVLPRAGESYVLKEYNLYEKFRIESQGYKILEEVISENPDNQFKVVHAEPQGNNTLKLTDIRGRNLNDVMNDTEIPQALKDKVTLDYNSKLKNLGEALNKKYGKANVDYFSQAGSKTLSANIPVNGEFLPISIRSMQVIVSFGKNPEDFTLTIIDPF